MPELDIPNPPDVEYWREWASQVVSSNLLVNVALPTKLAYPKESDWEKWASYFIDSDLI